MIRHLIQLSPSSNVDTALSWPNRPGGNSLHHVQLNPSSFLNTVGRITESTISTYVA